jgi:ankyrin repeat protein
LCFIAAFILPFFFSVPKAKEDINKISDSLMTAVEERDISKARELISKGADVNYSPDDFPTPLLTATALGDLEMVKLLVKNKADLDFSPENLPTPLYLAVTLDEYEIVKLLLDKGADPNKKSLVMTQGEECYITPIYPALLASDRIFKALINKKINVAAERVMKGDKLILGAPLEMAISLSRYEKVKLLIEAGAPISGDALYIAFNDGSGRSIIDYLIKKGATISEDFIKQHCIEPNELHFCIDNGVKPEEIIRHNTMLILNYYGRLETLLSMGLPPNSTFNFNFDVPGISILYDEGSDNVSLKYKGVTYSSVPLLIMLTLMNRYTSVEFLLENGANPNISLPGGETAWMFINLVPIPYAAQYTELLEKYGAEVGFKPLFEAQGKLELYDKWAAKNLKDSSENIPAPEPMNLTKEEEIIEKVNRGDIEGIKKIIEEKTNLNFRDQFENTPLLMAISRKNRRMVEVLIKGGADPNYKGFVSPIIGAICVNDLGISRLLIEKGANLDDKFLTFPPLAYAISFQRTDIAEMMLKYKPNFYNALFAAMVREDISFMEKLLKMGADPNMPGDNGSLLIVVNGNIDYHSGRIAMRRGILNLLLKNKVSPDVFNPHFLTGILFDNDTMKPLEKYPTPLLVATIIQMDIDSLMLLLDNGANPNIQQPGEETPVMYAVSYANCDYFALAVLNYLVESGADPFTRSADGFSAFDLAGKPSEIWDNKCMPYPSMGKIIKLILVKGKKR